jgi:PAS domain S-box-containing protein
MTTTENGGPACFEAGILENALVIIAVLEKTGKILGWNRAAEDITGYSRDEAIGNREIWQKLYPEKEYRDGVTRRIAGILATKNYFENFETTITTRSGELKNILWNAKEITTPDGSYVVTIGQDITHISELDAFQKSIIENANVLITVLDSRGSVILWNHAAEEITGYSRAETIGSAGVWKKIYPDPGYRRDVTRQIAEIITEKKYFTNLEATITTRSGLRRIISWNARQIEGHGKSHIITIGIDITELKEAQELIAYMTEMSMRITQPVGIIRDNMQDIAELIRAGKLSSEEIAMLLDAQVRNATQIGANVQEFQKAVVEKHREIPEAYRKFLSG